MDSSDEKAQIKKRQNAERARKYRERKKLEKEQQRAVAVGGEASIPAAPSQQKRKQDDLLSEELNEYLINTPFASMMTEQEKIDAFYNMKLSEKRRKTNERVKRCRLNKKQDDLMHEELNEYLINTPFASTMTEQEKIKYRLPSGKS